MKINSRMIRKIESLKKGIKIMFDSTVRITRSDPTMTPMTLFSNIGGCVGLTSGYSILHLIENVDLFLRFCWKQATSLKQPKTDSL